MKNFKRVSNFVAVIAAFLLVAGTAMASTPVVAPTPILFSGQGNLDCADLNAIPNTEFDGAFTHMTTDWEFKDDSPENTTLQPIVGGSGGWTISGGMSPNANMFLTYTLSSPTVMSAWSLSWNTGFLDRLVSAVILKGGPEGTNAYVYPMLDNGDTGPFSVPGGTNAISHITWCFEPFTAPTAAPASVSGRVTDRYGRGISSAIITVVDLSTGETKYAYTSSFGYYKVDGLPVANFYSVGVRHSRYTFVDPVQTFSLDDNVTNLNFTATR